MMDWIWIGRETSLEKYQDLSHWKKKMRWSILWKGLSEAKYLVFRSNFLISFFSNFFLFFFSNFFLPPSLPPFLPPLPACLPAYWSGTSLYPVENANNVPFGFQWASLRTLYVGNSRKSKGRSQAFTLQICNQHFMSRYPRVQTTVQPCSALYYSDYWAERCLLSQHGSCSKCGHCAKFPPLVTATGARMTCLVLWQHLSEVWPTHQSYA